MTIHWKTTALAVITFLSCETGTAWFERTDEPTFEGPFVAVPKALTGSDEVFLGQALDKANLPSGSINRNDTFYIAIHKNELGQKWFMSAYLTQLFPRTTPAAFSLGTRVVTFQAQNGKLFVFDVDERKKTSDSANPQVIVEAYPLVVFDRIQGLPNASDYLLFDPAAGLNRFNFVADTLTGGSLAYVPPQTSRFEVELMFSQRFRKIADGITFDQVFTGSSELPDPTSDASLDRNPFRLSGSIGVALRRYRESPEFKSVPLPEQAHYFASDTKIVPYESRTEATAAHWNIQRGMRPIVWKISPQVRRFMQDPRFAQYDVLGSMVKGVEAWNTVFGFQVFEAKLAGPDESPGDDDTNFIHFDIDNLFGYAFADWRTNPNTGEIRGASVYFSSLFIEITDAIFTDDLPGTPPPSKMPALPARKKTPTLSWSALGGKGPLCALDVREMVSAFLRSSPRAPVKPMTKKEKVEKYVTYIIQHEIGHDLGLRHNFKGSLVPPTSSVMEYSADDDIFASTGATETYDRAAIGYLYGLAPSLPAEPFCTDESYGVDVQCDVFDRGANPLVDFYAAPYGAELTRLLSGQSSDLDDPNFTFFLGSVLASVRGGADSMERLRAFDIATNGIAVPLSAANATNATYAAAADRVLQNVLARLYLALGAEDVPNEVRALYPIFYGDVPATDAALVGKVVDQLRGVLQNKDLVRSFESRRAAVDILKKMQTLMRMRS